MRPSLRSTAPALLISAAVSGLLCVWAVSAAPSSVRTPLGWGGGVTALALTAAVTAAAHFRELNRQSRERGAALTARADQLAAKARRAEEDVRRTVAEARLAAEESARSEAHRAATVSACANAAGRMQAIATGVLADLRAMEHRHTNEDVLADLLHLDHRAAQAGRLADSIAVLTGARSGRRWARPIVMESILRGALGRISGYQRVRLHSTSQVAVAGHAAEGVMHALAELLDNAANFSPPTAEVHVYVEEVPAGVVITVEDSGLVMSDLQLRRAERAVTTDASDLSGLSGTRLGLAVVGRLALKHGLTISFRPSARGGTGALMLLPQELITEVRPGSPAPEVPRPPAAPLPVRTRPAVPAIASATASVAARTAAPAPVVSTTASTAEPKAKPAPKTARRTGRRKAPAATATSGVKDATDTGTGPDTGTPDTSGEAPAAEAAEAKAAEAPVAAETADAEAPVELGESGLPKRRRGRTLAAALLRSGEGKNRGRTAADASAAKAPPATPDAQAARFSNFRKSVRTAPTSTTTSTTTSSTATAPATDTAPEPESEPVATPTPTSPQPAPATPPEGDPR
ncbi:sensor histidine kinase [Streptomyces paludis]|uniref:histidine kinase n=1 Tax=Streptomyces paludis TaxID=2282738 RepID=A0A345HS19_9ACTN|nr:ATP-binding protein [Streptomyces paludis]AXG79493.1 ATP-binding protein [Streptomyces paludis]